MIKRKSILVKSSATVQDKYYIYSIGSTDLGSFVCPNVPK